MRCRRFARRMQAKSPTFPSKPAVCNCSTFLTATIAQKDRFMQLFAIFLTNNCRTPAQTQNIKALSQNAVVFSESLFSYRRKITVTVRVNCDFYCDSLNSKRLTATSFRKSVGKPLIPLNPYQIIRDHLITF